LPWQEVTKDYIFEGTDGKVSLSDLFDGRSQLIVYHFMFDPEWEEGCKSCSLLADHYDPSVIHLRARDATTVTVARAPLSKLEAFRVRMGWKAKWVSSLGSDFNRDFHVSFTPAELEQKAAYYNYREGTAFPVAEGPGVSVFAKNAGGDVFHTYSAYARGLDILIGAYNLLDLVPKGRDEEELSYGMEWVRHRDRYGDGTFVDPYVTKDESS
jgi:predicted dithiol-disulfide oxidoreductase (DUF899 family)